MARKKSPTLTDSELRLMRIIWDRGPSSVGDVVGALPESDPLAYSSVLTTMRILEQKGYLNHEKDGRAFIYNAVVGKSAASRRALDFVLDRFFDNSAQQLVLNVLDDGDIDAGQLEQIKQLLKDRASEGADDAE
jgi:BlaI family transcriptional regulator, penicillinase repressor